MDRGGATLLSETSLSDRLVVDASVAVSWLLTDEASRTTEALLLEVLQPGPDGEPLGFWVPSIWPLEMVNSLAVAHRRGRLTEAQFWRRVTEVGRMSALVDQPEMAGYVERLAPLCVTHRLAAYDTAYLELAIRRRATLATLDGALRAAAEAAGVAVRPLG